MESDKESGKHPIAFELVTEMVPKGDQPQAIQQLIEGVDNDEAVQTLMGITGSGKTYVVAQIIEHYNRPTLIMAPNKTLAAQLYGEFKTLFPNNAVMYFTSYYDYYQPEAYLPKKDLFIDKDFDINEEIERLRHHATQTLASREDVIVIASVSCIFGIGPPEHYRDLSLHLKKGTQTSREQIIKQLVAMQYMRNDLDLQRRTFRVRGDIVDIYPVYGENYIRVELFGNEIDRLTRMRSTINQIIEELDEIEIFPGRHYVTSQSVFEQALEGIAAELAERLEEFKSQDKLVEAQRLEYRTRHDLEMLRELGYCSGVENYSRFFEQRAPGTPPFTLLDHFPSDFLLIIDESHIAVPQIRGMYRGDLHRKQTLVDFGWRLPAAIDNRPLTFEEFEDYMRHTIFTTATPGPYELEQSSRVVDLIIRPTGLVDPKALVRPTENQIDDLLHECKARVTKGQRVLITTMTIRMAEELADYLKEQGLKADHIHAKIDTLDRIQILRDLRLGNIEVLVGINLLREGLDLPEVSLVAILDADKEGFLRSERSLIQTMGRAARNVDGTVLLYADKLTDSMSRAINENNRRRRIQQDFNRKHGITPTTVKTKIRDIMQLMSVAETPDLEEMPETIEELDLNGLYNLIEELTDVMKTAAESLEFEKAATYRDKVLELRTQAELFEKQKQ